MNKVRRMVAQIMKEEKSKPLIERLRKHDIYSIGHGIRMAENAIYLMQVQKLDLEISVEDMVRGCLFHDIGKLSVPAGILHKDGSLTRKERQIIETHPVAGLSFLDGFSADVKNICLLHHEKLDGSGYPYGYPQPCIPEYCQLVSILDIMDALTSKRAYREPCADMKKLTAYLQEMAGTWKLNPRYVKIILRNFIERD